MASRRYYPTLVRMLHMVCVYIIRYRMQIEAALRKYASEEAVVALAAVLAACEAFTSLVELEVNP